MVRGDWVAGYRFLFAIATTVAIVWQLGWGIRNNSDFDVVNFFSFFTILSNLLATGVLYWFAAHRQHSATPTMEWIRGAAVTYMAVTGVVYGLLLSGYTSELQTALPWVNNLVHRIMPLVLVIDWLLNPPSFRFTRPAIPGWLVFPLLWLIYTLIRGPIVDWYPYPFLNPDRVNGYGGVALYCLGIALFIGLMCWLVAWSARSVHLRSRSKDTA